VNKVAAIVLLVITVIVAASTSHIQRSGQSSEHNDGDEEEHAIETTVLSEEQAKTKNDPDESPTTREISVPKNNAPVGMEAIEMVEPWLEDYKERMYGDADVSFWLTEFDTLVVEQIFNGQVAVFDMQLDESRTVRLRVKKSYLLKGKPAILVEVTDAPSNGGQIIRNPEGHLSGLISGPLGYYTINQSGLAPYHLIERHYGEY
jgi:hypothetical protein